MMEKRGGTFSDKFFNAISEAVRDVREKAYEEALYGRTLHDGKGESQQQEARELWPQSLGSCTTWKDVVHEGEQKPPERTDLER